MAGIFFSSEPENPLFENVKFKVGDRLRIIQAKGAENYPDDTRAVLEDAIGKVMVITDVCFWESDDPTAPHLTYEFCPTDDDAIFMDEDEVEPE